MEIQLAKKILELTHFELENILRELHQKESDAYNLIKDMVEDL